LFGVPHLATCIFLFFFYIEAELGVGIYPGMALTPLPSSIGQGSNPRPSDHEPSALPQLSLSSKVLLPLQLHKQRFVAKILSESVFGFEEKRNQVTKYQKNKLSENQYEGNFVCDKLPPRIRFIFSTRTEYSHMKN